jgi:hypothetical protein
MSIKSQELPPREPYSPKAAIEEVEQTFVFNNEPTDDQLKMCRRIEIWGSQLAVVIAAVVPEGKSQMVAINNVQSAVLWARHGIINQPTVELISTVPVPEMKLP